MRQILFLVCGGIAGIAFIGCAVELSLEAQRVAIMSEKPQDCALLGALESRVVDTSGAMSEGAIRKENENNLREQVAKLGGDTMRILEVERSWDFSVGGYENKTNAEAYKCDMSESNAINAGDSNESDKY